MKATVLDGISRDLSQVSTRRSMVRLLGGVAALGTLAVVGRGETDARKGKKGRKRNKKSCKAVDCQPGFQCVKGKCQPDGAGGGQDEVCRPGSLVAQLVVPYDGVPVQTPVLAQGQAYRFQVSGAAATNGEASVDAEYGFLTADPTNLAAVVDVPVGIDVGLSIDDATTDDNISPNWGPYNPSHVYTQQVIGQGRPAALQLHDGVYIDNSGAVNVTITCA